MKKAKNSSNKKSPLRADDLYRLRIPMGVAMSPGEDKVAYVIERMDEKELKYFSNIHLIDLKTGENRQFTYGNHNDGQPVFSPDGSMLAFVSTRNKKTGLYLMPVAGGAERRLIDLEAAISSLQWTPDGTGLLFCLRYNDSHFIKDEDKKNKPPVYRHITRLFYRLDGSGFESQDTWQVYTLDLETAGLRQITKGSRHNVNATISPDGRWVAYISNRSKDPDLDEGRWDMFAVPFKGGKERKIVTPAGPIMSPQFSPDGKTIAYLGHDNPDDAWGITNVHIWVVGFNGAPKARDLMPKFDRMAIDQTINDMGESGNSSPILWSHDGKRIYFASADMGVTNLYYIPRAGGTPTRIFRGNCHIKDFSLAGKTNRVAMVYSDLVTPGEIMTAPAVYNGEKKAKKHTDLNAFLRNERKLSRTREVSIKSFDGTKVQGWLVYPPDFKSTKKYPAVLEIHGGPRVQYGFTFMHEMLWLAAQGYVVLYTNPRGGSGRGETWADSIYADWGGLDYKDCEAVTDWLASQKFVNPNKMGVTGGSYGGYMTNWIVGHTNRFAAAITQRSVVNLTSITGSSDIGFAFSREFDGFPWEKPDIYERCSPITYFKNVRTPVLIIHSEQDLRCPIEQGEQMFVMLKVLGRKVEMVRFPEEPHGLSRHGRPDRRIARLEWFKKWFDRYLK
ncbi:MAG TPA: S9 family peptidase [candidate division Zixibacteria bacterium]|nr:S9 family peptidase [candidate division Zixibacteria bacterium]